MAMIEGMSAEKYGEMSRAIRERFDALVDYEAEAASIRMVLGL
jgi:hypothetical protein